MRLQKNIFCFLDVFGFDESFLYTKARFFYKICTRFILVVCVWSVSLDWIELVDSMRYYSISWIRCYYPLRLSLRMSTDNQTMSVKRRVWQIFAVMSNYVIYFMRFFVSEVVRVYIGKGQTDVYNSEPPTRYTIAILTRKKM